MYNSQNQETLTVASLIEAHFHFYVSLAGSSRLHKLSNRIFISASYVVSKPSISSRKLMFFFCNIIMFLHFSGPHRPIWAKYGEYKFLPRERWLHNAEVSINPPPL